MPGASTSVIQVGKDRSIQTIAEAARIAQDGDTVEIDAGDYRGDVAVWTQRFLTIRGVNGRPRLIASGAAVEGKGIWVMRGEDVTVENVEFMGARVADANGAGIRFEGRRLVVRHCRFVDNEDGILGGRSDSEIEIYNSEFEDNGAGDGQSHNLYIGGRRVIVEGSYFARARSGHLLKSRAQETFVLYNRLTGEEGTSSYELEFPDGGAAVVVGNLIQQGTRTENWKLVAFGREGYKFVTNHLYLSHNTLVNQRSGGGVFVDAAPGNAAVTAINNVSVGPGAWQLHVPATLVQNVELRSRDFVAPAQMDYRLRLESRAAGTAASLDRVSAPYPLRPLEEYVHRATTIKLGKFAPANPGAFQTLVP